jgi:hypothetical protein
MSRNLFSSITSLENSDVLNQYGNGGTPGTGTIIFIVVVLLFLCCCSYLSSSVAYYLSTNVVKETFDEKNGEENEKCKALGKTYRIKTPFGNYCI